MKPEPKDLVDFLNPDVRASLANATVAMVT
jgi:hypothetical protein